MAKLASSTHRMAKETEEKRVAHGQFSGFGHILITQHKYIVISEQVGKNIYIKIEGKTSN